MGGAKNQNGESEEDTQRPILKETEMDEEPDELLMGFCSQRYPIRRL